MAKKTVNFSVPWSATGIMAELNPQAGAYNFTYVGAEAASGRMRSVKVEYEVAEPQVTVAMGGVDVAGATKAERTWKDVRIEQLEKLVVEQRKRLDRIEIALRDQ